MTGQAGLDLRRGIDGGGGAVKGHGTWNAVIEGSCIHPGIRVEVTGAVVCHGFSSGGRVTTQADIHRVSHSGSAGTTRGFAGEVVGEGDCFSGVAGLSSIDDSSRRSHRRNSGAPTGVTVHAGICGVGDKGRGVGAS